MYQDLNYNLSFSLYDKFISDTSIWDKVQSHYPTFQNDSSYMCHDEFLKHYPSIELTVKSNFDLTTEDGSSLEGKLDFKTLVIKNPEVEA